MRIVQPTDSVARAATMHDLGGEGPPVVICHATGFCGLAYAPLAEELTADHSVWAVDLRGHGHADAPDDGDFSYGAMARDLVDQVAALDAGPVCLLGHSMGGAVALLAAGLRPDFFRCAYVFEPAVLPDDLDLSLRMTTFAGEIRKRRDTFGSRAEAFAAFAGKAPYKGLRRDVLAAFVEHGFEDRPDGSVRLRCLPESEARCYELNSLRASDYAHVTLPVVVGCGAGDDFGAGLVPPAITASLPGGQTLAYEQLSHFGPLEDPAAVGRDIRKVFANHA